MRVAFYAPLKAPDHPVPSGDRQIARLLLKALAHAGLNPVVASTLRLFENKEDKAARHHLEALAAAEANRLLHHPPFTAWITYHHYHKAPDFLGEAVATAMGIPYILIEASLNPKYQHTPWGRAAARIVGRADAVLQFNPKDIAGIAPFLRAGVVQMPLPLFLDTTRHPIAATPGAGGRLLAVGMLRGGDKLASYRVLAEALNKVEAPWTLTIVGDGPARGQVEALFPQNTVRFAGLVEPDAIPTLLTQHDLFVWPAVNEALGMSLLEASAAGLPVLAGFSPGVATIIEDGVTGVLVPQGDVGAFAAALQELLNNPTRLAALGAAGRAKVQQEHGIAAAAEEIKNTIYHLSSYNN